MARFTDYFLFLDRNQTASRRALRDHFGIDDGLALEAREAWMRTYEPELTAEARADIYMKVRA